VPEELAGNSVCRTNSTLMWNSEGPGGQLLDALGPSSVTLLVLAGLNDPVAKLVPGLSLQGSTSRCDRYFRVAGHLRQD